MRVDEYLASSVSSVSGGAKAGGLPSPSRALADALEVRRLAAAAVVALCYYFGVQVGLALTFAPSPISTLWPPNAILLAALLLTPPRLWWLPIAAILPAHFAAELSLGVPLTMAACWFASNVAEALLGAALMFRILGGAPRFDRVRDFSIFLACGVVLAPVMSSFLDAGFVALVGWRYNGEYWQIWRMRLLSNALATLTLVPLIVIWFQQGLEPLRRATFAQSAEVFVLLAGICVTSVVIFHQSHPPGASAVLMYAPLPFLVWAAIRRGVSGVSLCVVIVAMLAISGVLAGRGPFASSTPETAAFNVQIFLIIAASSLMLLAASFAELRRARADELRQRESLNLALGAVQMGIWEWSIATDRIIWRLNQEASATAASGVPMSLGEVLERVHADDRAAVRRAIDQAFERGDTGEVEFRIQRAPGDLRWMMGRGKLLSDAGGNLQRMIGVCRDITDRKSQQAQNRAQREQLERLNRVSILGEFSGALAHELNQPLAAILANAQAALLALQVPDADCGEIAEILADIVSDDKRASEVIRRLRELLMRRKVQRQLVDPNECIREVLELQHSNLIERNVLAEVRLAERIPTVMADRVQLQQVLLNLIVNACDAMAQREPCERLLRIVSVSGEDGAVRIDICDNGIGVEDPEAIFAPFFSTKNGGIGLGLAICRTIVASHRGRLWASNNATRGATLHIWMPPTAGQSPGVVDARRE